MIARQTVYLTRDRSKAVLLGDNAQFLLVRAGQEIPQHLAELYEGAVELIGGTKVAEPVPEPNIITRDPEIKSRDPAPKRKR